MAAEKRPRLPVWENLLAKDSEMIQKGEVLVVSVQV
jgi:hypothetical protein